MNNQLSKSPTSFIANRSTHTWIFLLILLIGAYLRFANLGDHSLWTDELYSIGIAQLANAGKMIVPYDQHPPLFYFLMQWLIKWNTNEWALRLPSAILGTLAIPLAWQLGVVIKKPQLGLINAALWAFAPLLIWYSREARMYGIVEFFWAGALYFYARSIYKDGWLDFVGLASMMLVANLTAYPSFALWFIQIAAFFLLWYFAGHHILRLLRWLLAQALIWIGFSFWIPYFETQMTRSLTFQWKLPGRFSTLLDVSGTLQETIQRALLVGGGMIFIIILLSIFIIWRPQLIQRSKKLLLPTLYLLLSIFIMVTVAGSIQRGLSIRRQLLVFMPLILFGTAWALAHLQKNRLTIAFVSITLICGTIVTFSAPYENWQDAIAYLETAESAGDIIVVAPQWQSAPLKYYYTGQNSVLRVTNQGRLLPDGTEKESLTDFFTEPVEEPTEKNRFLAKIDTSYPTKEIGFLMLNDLFSVESVELRQTVWLVYNSHPTVMWESERARNELEEIGRIVESTTFPLNVTITAYLIE